MGVMWSKIGFVDFSIHPLVRGDFKYINYKKNVEINYPNSLAIKEIIKSYYKGFAFLGKDFSANGEIYAIKGDIFNNDFSIDYKSATFLPTEHFENNKYLKFQVSEGDVIVSLVGSIGKMVVVDGNKKSLLNQNNIALQVDNDIYNNKLFAYLLKDKIRILVNSVYKNSGYSFLAIDDLFDLRLPNILIEQQNIIIDKIIPIEKEIKKLELSKKKDLEIINEIFSKEFKIDLNLIDKIDKNKIFTVSMNTVSVRNSNLRNSLRWNKIQEIQKVLYSKINCIDKLGNHIIETKNGWSPSSQEGGTGTPILGQEHFNHTGVLHISPSKTTEETRNLIENFYIKKGDFFVSRGNTVDLVALASIVQEEINDNILFPDLYIRIKFNEDYIYKEYITLLFNSFFGRYYFKYVSKGKNQTMVKISSLELNEFYLPIPNKKKQIALVKKIELKIDAQKTINRKIEEKQNKISRLIENAIEQYSQP